MIPYENSWLTPPGPIARVLLRSRDSGREVNDVAMLIDSGADVTLVPSKAVEELRIAVREESNYRLVGFNGSASTAQAIRLELIFCQRLFRGQFLLIDQDWGILGRNVLHAVPLAPGRATVALGRRRINVR